MLKRDAYARYNLPEKMRTENRIFSLICQLEKELQEIVEGSDDFLLTVSMTRAALKRIKRFF
jgi:hypothetical protein